MVQKHHNFLKVQCRKKKMWCAICYDWTCVPEPSPSVNSTSNSKCILVLLVAGEEHAGAEVFTGELLPRRRQVFLLVCCLNIDVQYHMKQLRILLRRVTCIQIWSATSNGRHTGITDLKKHHLCGNITEGNMYTNYYSFILILTC